MAGNCRNETLIESRVGLPSSALETGSSRVFPRVSQRILRILEQLDLSKKDGREPASSYVSSASRTKDRIEVSYYP
jgi:hypothetical protein